VLLMGKDRKRAEEILVKAKPPVSDDVVYIHASVEGWKGRDSSRDEFVRTYYPLEIGGVIWRAISWTTAASVCAVLEMVRNGSLPSKGCLEQEKIQLNDFLVWARGQPLTFDYLEAQLSSLCFSFTSSQIVHQLLILQNNSPIPPDHWYAITPVHYFMFRGMLRNIARAIGLTLKAPLNFSRTGDRGTASPSEDRLIPTAQHRRLTVSFHLS